ncbi:hypothetical protein [Salidesulfovibrio brasiliensis]|uniref:hypothetical protein n=1 Tax=Salidesulfovibrio brasiliensis TaxID=221711 RepID=UPI0006CFE5B5|nr:hypothetical protein [Salidesulfovibrio brasiliensis]
MEIGWYLRFAKTDVVEMKADPGAVPQLFFALDIHRDWDMDTRDEEDYVVAVYKRKEPVWSKRKEAEA